MAAKYNNYQQNMILQSENARLRKKIEAFETGEEYIRISRKYEKEIKSLKWKLERTENKLSEEHGRWKRKCEVADNLSSSCFELKCKIYELKNIINEKDSEISILQNTVSEYKEVIGKLKTQINRDFTNSSIPSSQKPNHKVISNSRKPSGKKAGAQPGHKGHSRKRMPADEIVHLQMPEKIISDDDYYNTGKQMRRRLVEIMLSVKTTEYVADIFRSRMTGSRIHAEFPSEITNEINYGSSVKALAFMLNNYCNVSIRKTQEVLKEISNGEINMSVGTISSLGKKFSSNTAENRRKIYAELLVAPYMNSDTTHIRTNGKQKYVVVTANEKGVLYYYRNHKGIESFKGTPVEDFQNVLIHDHDKSYYHYGDGHQECLAHVLRYLQDSIENEPRLTWNKDMKEFLQNIIHQRKTGGFSDEEIAKITDKYKEILKTAGAEYKEHPPSRYYPDGKNLMKRLDKYMDEHLRFISHNNLPYTNNLSERLLRQIKRKSKQIGCFRSAESASYFCDALSIMETAKQNNISIYESIKSGF